MQIGKRSELIDPLTGPDCISLGPTAVSAWVVPSRELSRLAEQGPSSVTKSGNEEFMATCQTEGEQICGFLGEREDDLGVPVEDTNVGM